MRFLYIAITAALAATAIAAPLPDEGLTVKGGGGAHAGGSISAPGKRDLTSEVSAEIAKLISDLEKLLPKRDAAPEEDLTVNSGGSLSADGSVTADVKRGLAAAGGKPVHVKGSGDLKVNGKREPAAVADRPLKVSASGDGKLNVGSKRSVQSLTSEVEGLIKKLEKALEGLL